MIAPASPPFIDNPYAIAYGSAPAVAVALSVATAIAPEKAAAAPPGLGGSGPVPAKK